MDELVKQRLVGAVILAILAMVLIPWLFGDPKDPRETIHPSFSGTPVPLSPVGTQQDIVLLQNTPAPSLRPQSTATPRRVLSPAQAQGNSKPAASLKPTAKPRPPEPSAAPQAWLIQLISYNNKKSADDFRARLRKDGLVAYREKVSISGKTYYRVRLKVQGSKSQAKDLQKRLENKYRIQAKLLPYAG